MDEAYRAASTLPRDADCEEASVAAVRCVRKFQARTCSDWHLAHSLGYSSHLYLDMVS